MTITIEQLESRINRKMHENPPSVFAALGIHTAHLGKAITVTRHGRKIYAGVATDEYASVLGKTEQECDAHLQRVGI